MYQEFKFGNIKFLHNKVQKKKLFKNQINLKMNNYFFKIKKKKLFKKGIKNQIKIKIYKNQRSVQNRKKKTKMNNNLQILIQMMNHQKY